MPRKGLMQRVAWGDRYVLPQRLVLLNALDKQQRAVVDFVRASLLALPGVEESLTWRGIPWRWTFGYSLEGESDRPWAYLIPQPGRPTFVMPMRDQDLPSLDLRRLSRPIREMVELSAQVAGTRWPQWPLLTRTLAADLVTLARRRSEAHAPAMR